MNDPFHIKPSKMGKTHASFHRVIAGVMNLTFSSTVCLFFSPGAPSLASQGFNTSTAGAHFEPPPALATNPPFRTPRLLRASARAVRCAPPFIPAGRMSLGVSFLAGRVPGSPAHASNGGREIFENNRDAPVTVHLAPFLIKNPNLATVLARKCALSLSLRSRSILTKHLEGRVSTEIF
jgi:hypothetical protein